MVRLSGNDGFTIFAAMKFANTSFIQTSSNHFMVTRSPNHMCAVSWAIRFARDSCWSWVAVLSRNRPARCRRLRRRAPSAELKRRHQHEVELLEGILAICVPLEPLERLLVKVEDRLAVRGDLGRVGFPVVEVEGPAVRVRPARLKCPAAKPNR